MTRVVKWIKYVLLTLIILTVTTALFLLNSTKTIQWVADTYAPKYGIGYKQISGGLLTGLEVEDLNGEPGVYSARYAGDAKDSEANMDLLLENLNGKKNRNAQFKTIISLYWKNEFHEFEGIVKGKITESRSGDKGFG